ncbi:Uncharacterised protein [Vibrio cholerae]|nr:Uncharacterised protein [Vibrio cholerae]
MTFLTNLTFLGSSLDDAALADSFPILETLFAMGKKNITSPNTPRVAIPASPDLISSTVPHTGRIAINT